MLAPIIKPNSKACEAEAATAVVAIAYPQLAQIELYETKINYSYLDYMD